MPIPYDAILERKLITVKLLYEQARKHAEAQHSVSSRIFAVIGFSLAIEALLNILLEALEPSETPKFKFQELFVQCDRIVIQKSLPPLPNRGLIVHCHSIRNDAQHKAKYPNESDVSDCRTYTRDFCREAISNIWGIAFDDLSLIEMIDDNQLKDVLKASLTEIHQGQYKKAMALAEAGFFWARQTIWDFIPSRVTGIFDDEYRDSRDRKIKFMAERDAGDVTLFYPFLLSTGISFVDYKRFKNLTVVSEFWSDPVPGSEENVFQTTSINIKWGDKNPNEAETLWVHNFVVNSILNWQNQGFVPEIPDSWRERANALLAWGDNVIMD